MTAFCDQVVTIRADAAARASATESDSTSGSIGDPAPFIVERDAYQALIEVAPPDLVPDLELLVTLDDELITTVEEIGERKQADPSYNGIDDFSAALKRLEAEGRVAAGRVNVVLDQGCNLDEAPTETTPSSVDPTPDGTAAP